MDSHSSQEVRGRKAQSFVCFLLVKKLSVCKGHLLVHLISASAHPGKVSWMVAEYRSISINCLTLDRSSPALGGTKVSNFLI